MGGIHVQGTELATPLKGVFAAGEVANVSLHGANRLGSNSLPACLVTGKWAGRSAFAYISALNSDVLVDLTEKVKVEINKSYSLIKKENGSSTVYDIRNEVQTIMEDYVGVFRNEDGLMDALKRIKSLKESYKEVYVRDRAFDYNLEWVHAHEVTNLLDMAEVITNSALTEKNLEELTLGKTSRSEMIRTISSIH